MQHVLDGLDAHGQHHAGRGRGQCGHLYVRPVAPDDHGLVLVQCEVESAGVHPHAADHDVLDEGAFSVLVQDVPPLKVGRDVAYRDGEEATVLGNDAQRGYPLRAHPRRQPAPGVVPHVPCQSVDYHANEPVAEGGLPGAQVRSVHVGAAARHQHYRRV